MAVFKRVIGLTSAIVSKGTGAQQKTVSRALTIHSAWCTGGYWFTGTPRNFPLGYLFDLGTQLTSTPSPYQELQEKEVFQALVFNW